MTTRLLPLLLGLLATPVAAQTHEPVTGATAGRSPHVVHRELRPARRPCGLVRHSLPAGKLPVLGSHHPCPAGMAGTPAPAGGAVPHR